MGVASPAELKRLLEDTGIPVEPLPPIELHTPLLDLQSFLEATVQKGEPIFMSDWSGKLMTLGRLVKFCEGTQGIITRQVPADEYNAWKDRCFPGRPPVNKASTFWEISVD